jgi:glycosyltransferase involved in cell wall biosynthesis
MPQGHLKRAGVFCSLGRSCADPMNMDWKQACAALIPCFNEATAIGEVVRAVHQHLPVVLVVDDGSTDDTAANAATAGAEMVRHATNRGKGAALRVGFQHLRDRGFQWALTLDGDGQHAADDIPKFFQRAEAGGASLIVGDRLSHAEKIPPLRRRVNRWMTKRLSRRAGLPLADSQCGFRLVNLAALSGVELTADHFEIESELLLRFVAAGRKVEFVPIEVIYKTNASKIHPLVDTWRWLRWWFASRRE